MRGFTENTEAREGFHWKWEKGERGKGFTEWRETIREEGALEMREKIKDPFSLSYFQDNRLIKHREKLQNQTIQKKKASLGQG
ncbi:hypothetical protein L6452_03596 [Arctium lappa]|uniref:Uncharacterized protein n=1 Tax=Arctium lappa TaxID=4217 RepID=A0ACB9FMN4_ARCLA|nr:hypothetical protein L6452_03596 [Arctium lappa]